MLTLIHTIACRPWAVQGELAAHIRGMVLREGIAGLRHLAQLKAAIHAHDDEDGHPRAARGSRGVPAGASVAVVPVIGTLTQRGDVIESARTRSTADIADEVRAAAAEPKVDAVVLEVDSGGGEVFGVPEAWQAIREARKLKPVVAVANAMAGSAAYYLASAADELWVTPSGMVGSIGVYALHVDLSKWLEAEGEKWTFVSAGRFKVEGNPAEPLGEEAAAAIQVDVDRYYDMFVRDVARGRGVAVEAVRAGFGEGRMVGARAAVTERMADQVGTLEQAIRRAAQLGQERRRDSGARAEAVASGPQAGALRAGITSAPNLAEGDMARSCMNCAYYSKPSSDHDGGACSRHDFHTMDMWVCDDWEARGEMEKEGDGGMAADRRAALARLGSL